MNPNPSSHRFRAYDLSLAALRLTRAPLARIRRVDRSIADQLQRAAASVSLNLAEGAKRRGPDRAHFYRMAAGSAAEARACFDIAAALGLVEPDAAAAAWQAFDGVAAMLYRLTR